MAYNSVHKDENDKRADALIDEILSEKGFDKTYQVIYETISSELPFGLIEVRETISANSYAHAAWRIARILPNDQNVNLLDVIRLS